MTETKKYEIQQVSMNFHDSGYGGKSHLHASSKLLKSLGFMAPYPISTDPVSACAIAKLLYIGAVPKPGVKFHVYYTGSEKAPGAYTLVKQAGGLEELISEGKATESHFHEGLKTTTFYGSNIDERWSFHCKPLQKDG